MIKKITAAVLSIMLIFSLNVFAADSNDYKGLLQTLDALDWSGDYPMDGLLSRAQFTKMAVMLSQKRDYVAANMSVSPFKDVLHTYWGTPYIHVAVTNGFVNGYKDGTFKPDDPVTYEDAVTIALRILGYTNDDFGASWPYGQIGIANKIELTENVTMEIGTYMTRKDAIMLLYNMLNTVPKDGNTIYINSLGYDILEETSVISSSLTDSSLGAGRVYTSSGTFKTNSYFDSSVIGLKGTVVTKGDEFILFYPETSNDFTEKYTVYAALANDILVYKDGSISSLGIPNDTVTYLNGQKTTLRNISPQLDIGYVLNVSRDTDNTIDYISVESNTLDGPYIVGSNISENYKNTSVIIKDGIKTTFENIKPNDIIYSSKALDTLWAYSKKVTGIYESASPNKDTPTSITLSGKIYNIEGADGYNALSSAGRFNYGDTITLLLGRNGDIAGVISPSADSASNETIIGYIIGAGTKQFTNSSGNSYASLYISVAKTDGNVYDYTCSKNYSSLINSIAEISFEGDKAVARKINISNDLYGKVSYDAMTVGNTPLAKDVEILDVSSTTSGDTALFAAVFPQRLDGLTLSKGNILYYSKNKSGEINKLILKNYTGDIYKYGIVTSSEVSSMRDSASYSYNIDGNDASLYSQTIYSVDAGEPAKFVFENNQIKSITPLSAAGGRISDISETYIKSGNIEYPLSDKATVYERKMTTKVNYLILPLSDLIKDKDNYSIKAYFDKEPSAGGRIRVIVAERKTN